MCNAGDNATLISEYNHATVTDGPTKRNENYSYSVRKKKTQKEVISVKSTLFICPLPIFLNLNTNYS
jgi:hypothetical protein